MKKYFLSVLLFAMVFIFNISVSNAQSSCVNLQNNLKVGSRDAYTNGEVSALQSFLYNKGYLNTSPSGYFGFATKRAVVLYQQNKGFFAIGYVGSVTRNAIYNDSCGYIPTPAPIPQPSPLSDYTISVSLYSSDLARNLSKNSNGYYDATGVNGNVNFSVSTSNNTSCSIYWKGQGASSYSLISSNKNFSQGFDSSISGMDSYKISCGDGVNYKNIDQYFYVQTNQQNTQSYYCNLNGQTYYSQNDYNNGCKNQNSNLPVTFDPNGASGSPSKSYTDISCYSNKCSAYTADVGTMVKNGYSFIGWSTSSSCADISCRGAMADGPFILPNQNNITLYAVWIPAPTHNTTGIVIGQNFTINGGGQAEIIDGSNDIIVYASHTGMVGGSLIRVTINGIGVPVDYCIASLGPNGCNYNQKILSDYGYKLNFVSEDYNNDKYIINISKL